MKYQSLIHPWNEEIWQRLTLEPERSNHALLLHGNAGLGKKCLAEALAYTVVAEGHSQSESLFVAASHPDLHVIMPEAMSVEALSETGSAHTLFAQYAARYLETHSGKPRKAIVIEQIRKLSAKLSTHPHISQNRVIVIYASETMNRNAANALLKSLEEPSAHTLFILICDEPSLLPKTVRSRCSMINLRVPSKAVALDWLASQNQIPTDDLETYLSMANNHPLTAIELYKNNYLVDLKSVFTDINHLWMRRTDIVSVAKKWLDLGPNLSVGIVHKLATDLLRLQMTDSPPDVFYPVQKPWIQSSSAKIDRARLLTLLDDINEAHRLLTTTVDPLLVIETVTKRVAALPK